MDQLALLWYQLKSSDQLNSRVSFTVAKFADGFF